MCDCVQNKVPKTCCVLSNNDFDNPLPLNETLCYAGAFSGNSTFINNMVGLVHLDLFLVVERKVLISFLILFSFLLSFSLTKNDIFVFKSFSFRFCIIIFFQFRFCHLHQ